MNETARQPNVDGHRRICPSPVLKMARSSSQSVSGLPISPPANLPQIAESALDSCPPATVSHATHIVRFGAPSGGLASVTDHDPASGMGGSLPGDNG